MVEPRSADTAVEPEPTGTAMTEDRFEEQDDRPLGEDAVPDARRTAHDAADASGHARDGSAAADDPLLDDEFLLELDEFDEPAVAPATRVAPSSVSGLEGLFDAPARGENAETTEYDELFDAHAAPSGARSTMGFAGAQPAPEFVEDHAGWLGDDVDLGNMLGEVPPAQPKFPAAEPGDPRDDGGDPFALEDIEVESLDELAAPKSDSEFEDDRGPAAPAHGDSVPAVAADQDDWAPFDGEARGGPMLGADDQLVFVDDELGGETDQASAEDSTRPAWAGSEFTVDVAARLARDNDTEPATTDEDLAPQGASAGFGFPTRGADADYIRSQGGTLDIGDELEVAPESLDEADPIYGDLAEAQPGADASEPEGDGEIGLAEPEFASDDSELAASIVESPASALRVVGSSKRSPMRWRRWAAAAVLLICVGGAIVAIEPGWLGLGAQDPGVERVEVARPRIDVALPPPQVVVEPRIEPTPTDPSTEPVTPVPDESETPGTTPVVPPVEVAIPVPVPPIDPIAVGTPPVPPVEGTKPVTPSTTASVTPNFSPLMVGEFLEVIAPVDTVAATVPGSLPIGTKALALMRNDEIFIGVVRAMDSDTVTLDLEPGRVSLAMASLSRIEPLAVADSSEAIEAERGFVRLKNETRFYGRVLRDPATGKVIVQDEGTRIVLPQDQVDTYGSSGSSATRVVFEGGDNWLDQRVREQLIQLGRGGVRNESNSAPGEDGAASTRTIVPSAPLPGRR